MDQLDSRRTLDVYTVSLDVHNSLHGRPILRKDCLFEDQDHYLYTNSINLLEASKQLYSIWSLRELVCSRNLWREKRVSTAMCMCVQCTPASCAVLLHYSHVRPIDDLVNADSV